MHTLLYIYTHADILDLVEERYLFDATDPYDSLSSSDEVPEVDVSELPAAFARP